MHMNNNKTNKLKKDTTETDINKLQALAKEMEELIEMGTILKDDALFTQNKMNEISLKIHNIIHNKEVRKEMQKQMNEASAYLHQQLAVLKNKFAIINEIRGTGFMIGVDLTTDSTPIVDEMLARGVLVNSTAKTVVRILPPLIAQKKEIDTLIQIFAEVLASIH